MTITISPSHINGTIKAPASKSFAQRALAASLLNFGDTILYGFSESDDSVAALEIIKKLGAKAEYNNNTLTIKGNPPAQKTGGLELNCGESGLSSRLFSPLSLLYSNNVIINGKGSLLKRPFGGLMKEPFEQMGIKYSDNEGKLPLYLKGEISSNEIFIDGSGGSQFLSGILMTLPLLPRDSVVKVLNLKSKPYIDITIDVLSAFGIKITHDNYETFNIKGNQKYSAKEYNIEGDWSGASCILVAGAVAGSSEVLNLDYNSTQADKRILNVLASAGAKTEIAKTSVKVSKSELTCFEFDATDCPDLFPALAALAVNCKGVSRIKGVSRLASKESDRAQALRSEYGKIGVGIELDSDCMIIKGTRPKGGTISSHNDHRIAMSLAVAALNSENPVTIENAECVDKSYPQFWNDFNSLMK